MSHGAASPDRCLWHNLQMTTRAFLALLLAAGAASAQSPVSGHRVHRLIIHNATVIDGNGTPASGPKDIVIENNTIADVIALDPVAVSRGARTQLTADAVIDATGKYVLPGLIDAHARCV